MIVGPCCKKVSKVIQFEMIVSELRVCEWIVSSWVQLKKVKKQVDPPKTIHIRFGLHPNLQQLTEEIILPRDKIIRQGMLQKKS